MVPPSALQHFLPPCGSQHETFYLGSAVTKWFTAKQLMIAESVDMQLGLEIFVRPQLESVYPFAEYAGVV